jgi:hypothetical protein
MSAMAIKFGKANNCRPAGGLASYQKAGFNETGGI